LKRQCRCTAQKENGDIYGDRSLELNRVESIEELNRLEDKIDKKEEFDILVR